MKTADKISEFLPPTQEQMLEYLESEVIAVRQQRDELADALEMAHANLQFKRGAGEKRITRICEIALQKVGRFRV